MQHRKLVLLVIILIVVALLLMIAPLVGSYLGAGSVTPIICLAEPNATELQALQNLHQGRVLERDGLIEGAVKEYTAALTAKSPTVVSNSIASLDRLRARREELGPLFNVVAFGASLSVKLRTPVRCRSLWSRWRRCLLSSCREGDRRWENSQFQVPWIRE